MFLWIFIAGIFLAFGLCCGIGGNDLANSFGTAYGAKVLTLNQIVFVAAICEFSGAMLLGGETSSTVGSSIAKTEVFDNAAVYMHGMMCALFATTCWLFMATLSKLPVSATHSIVGSVMGFAFARGGFNAIYWAKSKDSMPFVDGVVPIVISWLTSPVLTLGAAALMFYLLRTFVLRAKNPESYAAYTLPIIVFVAAWVNIFFVTFKGMKNWLHWSAVTALWVSALIAGCLAACSIGIAPFLLRYARRLKAQQKEIVEDTPEQIPLEIVRQPHFETLDGNPEGLHNRVGDKEEVVCAAPPKEQEEEEEPDENEGKIKLEKFDELSELIFKYLQILSSVLISFAHGANDSNSIGALAAIYSVYKDEKLPEKVEILWWMLALAGVGMVTGLAVMGRRILVVLGEDMVKLTPTRGFCAQFASSLVVSLSASNGLPVSTTHCITGAVIGIGLVEGGKAGVEWKTVIRIGVGWIITIIITAGIAALVFAQAVYAPCV